MATIQSSSTTFVRAVQMALSQQAAACPGVSAEILWSSLSMEQQNVWFARDYLENFKFASSQARIPPFAFSLAHGYLQPDANEPIPHHPSSPLALRAHAPACPWCLTTPHCFCYFEFLLSAAVAESDA